MNVSLGHYSGPGWTELAAAWSRKIRLPTAGYEMTAVLRSLATLPFWDSVTLGFSWL